MDTAPRVTGAPLDLLPLRSVVLLLSCLTEELLNSLIARSAHRELTALTREWPGLPTCAMPVTSVSREHRTLKPLVVLSITTALEVPSLKFLAPKETSQPALELPLAPPVIPANTAQELVVRLTAPLDATATPIVKCLARLDLTPFKLVTA